MFLFSVSGEIIVRKISIIFILITFISFNSCYSENSDNSLLICGSYAVPGMFYPDLKGTESSCEILETDKFGRIMFLYSAPNIISKQDETAVVICQKNTKEYVYFYEDICFEFIHNDTADFSLIKKRNDWNLPLNDNKMTYRKKLISIDSIIITESSFDINKIKTLCCEKLNIISSDIRELCIDDIRPDGTAVFYIEISSNGNTKKYFVLVNEKYETDFFEFSGTFYSITEEFIDFKNKV